MFPAKDLLTSLSFEKALDGRVVTSDETGFGHDMKDFNSILFNCNLGLSGDTLSGSVKMEFYMQHSDDNSTFVNVPDAEVRDAVTGAQVGTFYVMDDATKDQTVVQGQYRGKKRYVRVRINVIGTHTNGTPLAVTAVKGGKTELPV